MLKGFNPLGTLKGTVDGFLGKTNEMGGKDLYPLKLDGWPLPDEPMVSIVGSSRIVETAINRRQGVASVLEEIGMNAYKVKIQGKLYGDSPEEYPTTAVTLLRQKLEAKGSKAVEHAILNYFGIYFIAIKKWTIPMTIGTPNEQDYQIEALSDISEKYEMILKDDALNNQINANTDVVVAV